MDNSETSTAEDRDDLSEEEKNVRIFATQMLKSRIFRGQFLERRYVEPIKGYRDVILISNNESDLIKEIEAVRLRLRRFFGCEYWIGITNPYSVGAPNGFCIWVETETNVLGPYWYKIKGVKFRRNEAILKVKILRSMADSEDNRNITETVSLSFMDDVVQKFQNLSLEIILQNVKKHMQEFLIWFFTVVLTIENIKEAFTFLIVLLATIGAFSLKAIVYLMDFSLKFMRETSFFIHSATPITISVVNLIGKIFGGFYLLILTIWRDRKGETFVRTNYPAIEEAPRYRQRSSVFIKEIE